MWRFARTSTDALPNPVSSPATMPRLFNWKTEGWHVHLVAVQRAREVHVLLVAVAKVFDFAGIVV